MAAYYKGLKEEVKDDMARQERPETLEDMTDLAIRIDQRLYERRLERQGEYHHTAHRNKKSRGGYVKDHGGYKPMELDMTKRSAPRSWGPPPGGRAQELRYRRNATDRKKIQCYSCNLFGHISRNCLKKKQDQNSGRQVNASCFFLALTCCPEF